MKQANDLSSVLKEANQVINPKLCELIDMARGMAGGKGRNRWRNSLNEGRGPKGDRKYEGYGSARGDRQSFIQRGNLGREREMDRNRSSDRNRGEKFGNRGSHIGGGRGSYGNNTNNPSQRLAVGNNYNIAMSGSSGHNTHMNHVHNMMLPNVYNQFGGPQMSGQMAGPSMMNGGYYQPQHN